MIETTQILIKCKAREYGRYFNALLRVFGNVEVGEVINEMRGLK